jgi:hypothetical protein
MKKNPVLLIVVGVVLLVAGGLIHLTSGPPKADAATTLQCRQKMTAAGAEATTIAQCDQRAFANQMTATDATAAAQAISAANNAEIGSNSLAMFLIGFGLVLTLAGVVLRTRRRTTFRS